MNDTSKETDVSLDSSIDFKDAENAVKLKLIEQNKNKVLDTDEREMEKNFYKESIVHNFARLLKFLASLLLVEFKHAEYNPIRIQFFHLITAQNKETTLKKRNYSQFLNDCIKYCNQIDLNNAKQTESSASSSINTLQLQESVLYLVEVVMQYVPEVFVENFKLANYFSDDYLDSKKETSGNTGEHLADDFDATLNLIVKTLLDHLNLAKPETLPATNHVIKCLILQNKLNKKYFQLHKTDFDKKYEQSKARRYIYF